MRHLKAGKIRGDSNYRKALMRNMTLSLIEHEAIRTTPPKAKELRWYAERVVTLAKRGNLSGRRRIVQILGSTQTDGSPNRVRTAVQKLYATLAPRFSSRPGGYTQIFRLADRRPGDNAEMCLMRYIPDEEKKAKTVSKTPVKPTKKVKAASKEKAEAKAPEDKPSKKASKAKHKHEDK